MGLGQQIHPFAQANPIAEETLLNAEAALRLGTPGAPREDDHLDATDDLPL